MQDISQVLVIILSVVLIILLLILIAIGLYIFNVVKQLKRVTDTADKAVNNFVDASKVVRSSAQSASFMKLVNTMVDVGRNSYSNRQSDDEPARKTTKSKSKTTKKGKK